jgi:hypothetical protein
VVTAALLLAAALGNFALFLRRGSGRGWSPYRYGWFRRHRYLRLATRTFVHFGLFSLVALALAGQWTALGRFPAAFAAARYTATALAGGTAGPHFLSYALVSITVGGVAAALLERRGRRIAFGDWTAIEPDTPAGLAWGVVLSIDAGVAEELFFRLTVPLLATLATGSALFGVGLGIVLFGLAHRYQGTGGMIATGLVGVVLAGIYLLTADLWTAVAVHVAIDLNALVLRPLVSGRVRPFG